VLQRALLRRHGVQRLSPRTRHVETVRPANTRNITGTLRGHESGGIVDDLSPPTTANANGSTRPAISRPVSTCTSVRGCGGVARGQPLACGVNVTGGKRDRHETPAPARRRYVPRAMNLARTGFLSLLGCIFSTLSLVACGGSTSNAAAGDAGPAGEGGAGDDGGTTGDDGGGGGLPSGVVAVPLSGCNGSGYTAAVTLGGSQTLDLIVDTGSASLGAAAKGCACGGVAPTYTPGSTATDENQQGNSQFGTGQFTGEIYQDSVSMGSSPTAPTKLVAIGSETGIFDQPVQCNSKSGGMEGIVGFGPPGAEIQGTTTFFGSYVATNKVADVFATELCDTKGTLWLGGFDPGATTQPPQYVPLTSDIFATAYYSVHLESVTVGSTTVPVAQGQFADSVVDTGTSAFLVGTTAYNAIVAAIEGNAGFKAAFGSSFFPAPNAHSVACASSNQTKAALDASLPTMTLTLGTNPSFTVEASATESYLVEYGPGTWCPGLIGADQSAASGFVFASIMGSPVLRSSIVIFDRAQKRIGFAPHGACQ
jgi:hypothetical protein